MERGAGRGGGGGTVNLGFWGCVSCVLAFGFLFFELCRVLAFNCCFRAGFA